MAKPFQIAGHEIEPGTRLRFRIPIGKRVSGNEISLPVEVVHGRREGPRLFLCAAIHGDEINGVEIIRQVLRHRSLRRLRGTVIAVPIVNLHGFVGLSRYLPDRRDLNRSFPGSPDGSLAARVAHIFMRDVVANSTHGIDLHTGAVHRSNLPQIRACLDQPETERLARAFGVPVVLNANLRDGSLRQAVVDRDIPMLLYEAGEALRFDEGVIRAGARGVRSVMRALEMLPPSTTRRNHRPFIAQSSHWVRAPEAGVLRARARLGSFVEEGQRIGLVADPLGADEKPVLARHSGLVIGCTQLPLVNEGDALFHVACFERPERVASVVEDFQADLDRAGGEPS